MCSIFILCIYSNSARLRLHSCIYCNCPMI
uniref:Uncharacterized protein n=1 Tax=virus sp. ctx9V1 TaxID=2828001 RepID=A0A8S5RD68_9VIRU|nr:MAG TPA: hypothetical protein [virus sp. ctx9V1]